MPGADRRYVPGADEGHERPLAPGLAHAGTVVRVGDTVRRPPGPQSAAVHALLDHLGRVGFDGAPRFLGVDDRGRSVLTYVDGDVAHPPYPGWAAGAELLASVASLQRRFHDAVRSFAPPPGAAWDTTLAPDGPLGPTAIVGHNDVSMENVVCRAGRAVAIIDFDFAAPSDPLWDVAVALRHWAPVRDPADLDAARAGLDQAARYRAFCAAYGVAAGDRARVVAYGLTFLDRALAQMRVRAEAGRPGYVDAWRNGYEGLNRRAHAWLDERADLLAGA